MPKINIVVAPQINTAVGINLALFSPGATQTLVQLQSNNLGVLQY